MESFDVLFSRKQSQLTWSKLRSSPLFRCSLLYFCVFFIAIAQGETNTTDVGVFNASTYKDSDISTTSVTTTLISNNSEISTTPVTTTLISNNSEISTTPVTTTLISNVDVSTYQYDATISTWNAKCRSEDCYLQLNSSVENLEKSIESIETLYARYVGKDEDSVTVEGLTTLMRNLGILSAYEDENYAEEEHAEDEHAEDEHAEDEHAEDEHAEDEQAEGEHAEDTAELDVVLKYKCIESIDDVINEYYPGREMDELEISLSEFYLLMPRLIEHLQNPNCKRSIFEGFGNHDENYYDDDYYDHEDHDHENEDHSSHDHNDDDDDHKNHEHHGNDENHEEIMVEDRGKVWGIALVSVTVISLLSVVGILTVPLMGFSRWFKTLLSFLVALAVGTLIGDALLHLLPHAMGGHEHDHSSGDGEIEKMRILKSLVAVLGVYIFFLFESGMSIVRKRKRKRRSRLSIDSTPKLDAGCSTRSPSDDFLMIAKSSTDGDSLLYHSDNVSSNKADEEVFKTSDSGIVTSDLSTGKLPSTSSASSLRPLCNDANGNKTSALQLRISSNLEHTDVESTLCDEGTDDHHHHHHGDIANAQGIKDLAWMIIAGDGLHNFSDGLAIGAAFSSSISAGMSTSLAIFFHELPHELGDFAILIDAGMSIKKALAYNGLCACLAFLGAIIGLLIGEHTSTVKLWILAVTAGGFLYVALVDMLPQMLRQCVEKDGLRRFIFQNIGFLSGVIIMLLIAWFEESFSHIFNIGQNN